MSGTKWTNPATQVSIFHLPDGRVRMVRPALAEWTAVDYQMLAAVLDDLGIPGDAPSHVSKHAITVGKEAH